ncbi:uncharacterized protein A1O9_06309 [Exophiala aquamarina CBS 119918]|uniref:Clr5 domain-containing protein n=1 Tax=Exophiala aquamarina CBS 119918 TaxID=1182545 RepID=A0A072PGG5_9EURO|nr:uncharacterized protein A1O9_06309 [Exophiala aquamarina CBS 119918]KEF58383.1 hypothetical protein A1O9_06309 [Exophiala aquamarina CBS 119918]
MVKDWSSLQEDIKMLYHVEGQPLKEVMRIIKGRHGFHASERSYRTQLQKWGYLKYSTDSHPKPISTAQKVRSKRRASVRSTNQIPPTSSSDGVSRSATFQPHLPSFSILGHDPTDGLYYNAGLATAFHSSEGAYLGINASMPLGSTHVPLHYGFGLDEQDSNGKTQLHRATIDKSLDQVRTILFAGASVDIRDHSGHQALHYAAIADDLEIFKLLLQFGADVNAESDSVVDALLAYTSDMNLANKAGSTPFHKAVDQEYDAPTLKYLARVLDLGADINHALPDGRLPMQVFLARTVSLPVELNIHMNDVLKRFLAKGPDPLTSFSNGVPIFIRLGENQLGGFGRSGEGKTLKSQGETPLRVLVMKRVLGTTMKPFMVRMIQRLLCSGADPLLQVLTGRCIFYESASQIDNEAVRLLIMTVAAERKEPWPHLQCIHVHERAWWEDWRLAMQADYWTEAETPAADDGGEQLNLVFTRSAKRMLANKHLEKAKKMSYEGGLDEQETHRKYVAGILRDCRLQKVDIDLKYFHYLLELC